MTRSSIIKLPMVLLLFLFLLQLDLYGKFQSENFILSTNGLDGFGGKAESDSFLLRISSGGQSGATGISKGDSFYAWQGYVHTAAFVHGDCDADGTVGLADAVYLINYTFRGGPEPVPYETGDMDCPNNNVDLADVVYLINYLFRSGPAPCNL